MQFLHELLLPWFAVRNAIRSNDHKTLDWSWSYFLPLFRATNKNQYAAYAVQQATTVHMMCSDVRKVWNEHRTASMSGRPGRNVAWDYVLEKMNLNFKQYLNNNITDERLHDFGIMINALKHVRKMFEQAWRHGAGDPDDEEDHGEYSHVKDADVKVIVDALKDHLGGTVQESMARPPPSHLHATRTRSLRCPARTSSLGAKLRGQRNGGPTRPLLRPLQPPTAGLELYSVGRARGPSCGWW